MKHIFSKAGTDAFSEECPAIRFIPMKNRDARCYQV
jgi:hypothetical protein